MSSDEAWRGYSHSTSIKFTSSRKTRNSGAGEAIVFEALPGTWPGAVTVPKVEKKWAVPIPPQLLAEKQAYRRSAFGTSAFGVSLPGLSLKEKKKLLREQSAKRRKSKKRRRLNGEDDWSDEDSFLAGSTASAAGESDAAEPWETELIGHRTVTVTRNCLADQDDTPIPFLSSRSHLQDLEPYYYRFFQHSPKNEEERMAPLDESRAEEYHTPLFVLEYPAPGVYEEFFLVRPRVKDAYDPIKDLHDTVRVILEHFVTLEQCQTIFKCDPRLQPKQRSFNKKRKQQEAAQVDPEPDINDPMLEASSEDLLLRLDDAIWDADGDKFQDALNDYNVGMRQLKESGAMQENIRNMNGLKEAVWTKITSQAYDRAVSPRVGELRAYKPFSDEVYGELLAPFVHDIVHKAGLGPDMSFIDLGSGVGNCVVQAALAAGCESFGVELQDTPAELAELQIKEVQNRARMYGVSMGACKSKKGDMLNDPETLDHLRKADVVLCNNYAFKAETNLGLLQLFLELPDKCRIVSMQPFVRNRGREVWIRGGAHNILQQGKKKTFGPDCVSWMPKGGTYYIGHIDRGMVRKELAEGVSQVGIPKKMQSKMAAMTVDTSRDSSTTSGGLAEDQQIASSPDSQAPPPPETDAAPAQEESTDARPEILEAEAPAVSEDLSVQL